MNNDRVDIVSTIIAIGAVLMFAFIAAFCLGCATTDAERGEEVRGPQGYYDMIEREPDSIFAPKDD